MKKTPGLFNYRNILILLAKTSLLTLIIYWLFINTNIAAIKNCLKSANLEWLLAAYLMQHISLFFSALRSRYYFETEGCYLGKAFSLSLYYVGALFNIILPGGIGGDGYRIILLKKMRNFSKFLSLKLILYERINGLYALIVLFLLVFPLSGFMQFMHFIPYGETLLVITFLSITPCYLYGTQIIFKDNISRMLKASLFSFAVQIFQLIVALCVVKAIIPSPSFEEYVNYVVLFSIASIVAIIPITIGGMGLREITFFYGSMLIGLPAEQGIAYALVAFIVYVFTSFTGLPLYLKIKDMDKLGQKR